MHGHSFRQNNIIPFRLLVYLVKFILRLKLLNFRQTKLRKGVWNVYINTDWYPKILFSMTCHVADMYRSRAANKQAKHCSILVIFSISCQSKPPMRYTRQRKLKHWKPKKNEKNLTGIMFTILVVVLISLHCTSVKPIEKLPSSRTPLKFKRPTESPNSHQIKLPKKQDEPMTSNSTNLRIIR